MSKSNALCLSLQGSICPEFANYKAFIPEGSAISNIASFDTYVQQSYGPGFKDLVTRSSNGGYKCSGWNGENLRYMHSIVCAYYVGLGFAFGATGSSTPCNAITPRPFSLCASTFDAFSSSWDSIMNDRTICPSGVSVDSLNYKSLLLTSKALASTDAACVAGVLEENIECGFQTVGEAMAFCANVANAATNACCAQFLPSTTVVPAMDIATKALPMTSLTLSTRVVALTAAIATTTATISNSPSNGSINIAPHTIADGTAVNQESPSTESSNSRNLLVGIITGVAGAIVTVLATVVVLYFRRTRAKRASEVPSVGYKLSKIMINGTLTRLNKSVLPVAEAPQHGETLTALSDFDPQLPDEIQVTRHDKIIVDHVFDDLWATGFNQRTIKNGVFPLAVFSPPAYERLFAKRVSSINTSRQSLPPPVPPKDVTELAVPKQHQRQDVKRNQQVLAAIYNFNAELPDEIPVTAGDKITVMEYFDDGWAMGYSFRLNKVGILPHGCLVGDKLEQGLSSDDYLLKNRASSLHYSSSNTTVLDLESTESHD